MGRNARARSAGRAVFLALSTVVVVLVAGAVYWFQPWKLWTDQIVDEPLPRIAAVDAPVGLSADAGVIVSSSASGSPAPEPAATKTVGTAAVSVPPTPAGPTASVPSRAGGVPSPVSTAAPSPQAVLLADGEFISHEHQTTGSVELIRLANGHRVLTLENLRTSNGPALHVWLTDAPVLPGSDGWDVFDDGEHLDLGNLKGNVGNQMYPVGDDVDLGRYSSVTIWCERFSVSFGAAELAAA